MAQQTQTPAKNNITSIWIQDANGQPQMIRVLHATPAKAGAVRAVLKTTNLDATSLGTVISPQVLQSLVRSPRTPGPGPKLVAIPLSTHNGGSAATPVTTKRATPTPVQVLSPVVLGPTPNQQQPQQSVLQQQSPTKTNVITPILDHSGARKRQLSELDDSVDSKRRKPDRGGKGLRHFSMKVCEKVQRKGTTTYNEVADELVAELSDPEQCSSPADQYDQKNIRRRVYDALNVLMAMNIITKERKEIKWIGLPSNSQHDFHGLEAEKRKRMERVKQKTEQLKELVLQQVAFKSLVHRNKEMEKRQSVPPSGSKIQLPFLVVNTNKKTVIDCSISSDKMEYLFTFDDVFEIHDDMEVLKRMGLDLGLEKAQCSHENLIKAKSYVPKSLEHYVDQLAQGTDDSLLPNDTFSVKLEPYDNAGAIAARAGAITPSISVSTTYSDSEEEEEHSDFDNNE